MQFVSNKSDAAVDRLPSLVLSRNNVKIIGEGDITLLFGHGFGCDQTAWRYLLPFLSDSYKIVLFDYVGSGQSDLTAYNDYRYGTLDGYAMDIIEICKAAELDNICFIGHSVSAMIGLLAIKQVPDLFHKAVFIGPSPRYINDDDYLGGINQSDLDDLLEVMDSNYLGWSSMITAAIMGNENRPHLADQLNESFCATHPEIARKFARVAFQADNRADLQYLTIPSLTIQCFQDYLTSEYIAQYINQHTVNNKVVMLSSSGHCPHMSDPQAVSEAIRLFI
jgi:sigma-B regulation protein RsbQ